MTDIPHGPVTAQMIPLLTPGRSVLLCKRWGLMVLDRFDDSERRAFMIGLSDGQVRLLVPADKMTYIGERDDDGWITAPKGGWKSNPVPAGVTAELRPFKASGVLTSGWADANTYRAMLAARPKPPADLVRAVIQATDDGDHHPPISQWAAERAVEVVMGARPAPTVEEVLDAADKYLREQYGYQVLGHPVDRARIHALWTGEKG